MSKKLLHQIRGRTYFYEEPTHDPSEELLTFLSVLKLSGVPNILIAYATNPSAYKESNQVTPFFDYVWLTSRDSKTETTTDPENKERFIYDMQQYLSEKKPCVIVIDLSRFIPSRPGEEPKSSKDKDTPEWKAYEAQKNSVLKMLRSLIDEVSTTASTLIFTIGEGMLDETLKKVLERETNFFYNKGAGTGIYLSLDFEKALKTLLKKNGTEDVLKELQKHSYPRAVSDTILRTTRPDVSFKLISGSKELMAALPEAPYPVETFARHVVARATSVNAVISLFVIEDNREEFLARMKKSDAPEEELYRYLRGEGE
ncbi:MAG: hypothetical protein ABH829_02630 [archaeon]